MVAVYGALTEEGGLPSFTVFIIVLFPLSAKPKIMILLASLLPNI
jgi:hypothetical protein